MRNSLKKINQKNKPFPENFKFITNIFEGIQNNSHTRKEK